MPYDESIISLHKESMLGNFAHLQKKCRKKMSGGIMYKKKEFIYIFFMYNCTKITFTGTMWRTTCRMV